MMIKQTGRLVGACRFVLAGDGLTLTEELAKDARHEVGSEERRISESERCRSKNISLYLSFYIWYNSNGIFAFNKEG